MPLDRLSLAVLHAAYISMRGVNIHTQTEVLSLESNNGCITRVVTTRGDFLPQHVVMATGAWSPEWSRQLKLRLPIQPAKGYSFTVRRPAACPNMSLSLEEAQIAVTPMGSEMRFSRSTIAAHSTWVIWPGNTNGNRPPPLSAHW